MVYGYVNLQRGENENFLEDFNIDKIIRHRDGKFDFSFAQKGDTIIIYELKSVCKDVKELLELSQFVFENGIEICCFDHEGENANAFIDTNTAIGKMIINVLSALNEFDNKYFQNI